MRLASGDGDRPHEKNFGVDPGNATNAAPATPAAMATMPNIALRARTARGSVGAVPVVRTIQPPSASSQSAVNANPTSTARCGPAPVAYAAGLRRLTYSAST